MGYAVGVNEQISVFCRRLDRDDHVHGEPLGDE